MNLLPYVFVAVLVLGIAGFAALRFRDPEAAQRAGGHTPKTPDDVPNVKPLRDRCRFPRRGFTFACLSGCRAKELPREHQARLTSWIA